MNWACANGQTTKLLHTSNMQEVFISGPHFSSPPAILKLTAKIWIPKYHMTFFWTRKQICSQFGFVLITSFIRFKESLDFGSTFFDAISHSHPLQEKFSSLYLWATFWKKVAIYFGLGAYIKTSSILKIPKRKRIKNNLCWGSSCKEYEIICGLAKIWILNKDFESNNEFNRQEIDSNVWYTY